MNGITLQNGLFKASQEKGKEYLYYLEVDRLMAPFYEATGQRPKKQRYGGWESTGISGHSLGHWLSAASQMYAVTGEEALKNKVVYAIDELAYLQQLDGEGYVGGFPKTCFEQVFTGEFEAEHFSLNGQWVPWYSLHKVFAGLIDAYQFTKTKKALQIVRRLADWAVKGLSSLTEKQFQKMLICEHGGMNEALADVYLLTGEKSYLALATRFCHLAVLEPLARKEDRLEGLHANTQIPKVVGAAKLYEITGEEKYKEMALFFWQLVTETRSYIIGGNSINEHFGPAHQEKLGVQTTETCNTYNMLKLTEHLFRWTHESNYMDYYERALYNHILASQDPDSGMKTYFVSSEPGHFKVYCSPDHSFWCCTGTGMENPARYTRSIYTVENTAIFIHLFIASELRLAEQGLHITQETAFPFEQKTALRFHETGNGPVTIKIRVPYWCKQLKLLINGEEQAFTTSGGYLSVTRVWQKTDTVEVLLPMSLHTYTAKDDPKKTAVLYGPLVLAGVLGKENFPESDILADHLKLNHHPGVDVPALVADKHSINEWLELRDEKKLVFVTDAVGQPGAKKITLLPFFHLHHERYTIYWDLLTEEEYLLYQEEQARQTKQRFLVVDEVQPHEQQPEVEHQLKKQNSSSGYSAVVQKGWRDTRGEGYFSYQMSVDSNTENKLVVTYFGGDCTFTDNGSSYERDFQILIDDTVVAHQKLNHIGAPASTVDIQYPLPTELTYGKEKVEVTFRSDHQKAAGGVYGIKILTRKQ
ncbi:hypothetical protein SAMN05421736_104287 [Evansella caseinilytica]|uniref:Uncharacterized protein n=1 Tax=Evansella caseinilytica TaxID=1503961 RepID=A0A1H3P1T1_9BACI|nr:glycoside hydrolase family 127 protein [Evansella caseinilytica]SDY94755.1 hypothetical protein SAMN05421736_104287 [Evansella caseinilytica]